MATLPDGWIDADEFARRRGLPTARLGELVSRHRLFSTQWSGKAWYPAFMADQTTDIRSLEAVCRRLGQLPAGSKWQFFVTPKASLGGKTPLEALREGGVTAVRLAAHGNRER
ncbi:MAG: hypothetical protein JNL87_17955 [Burkholderiaceae bacterium]|nr:hypothetical protein [Burkholderiaceae bacterium]